MTITNADILTYIQTNRLHSEDSEFLLQEKASTMGVDAVSSAQIWIERKFRRGDRLSEYTEFSTALYAIDSTDLENVDTVRAALIANGATEEDAGIHMHLFDSLAMKSVANIWFAVDMFDQSEMIANRVEGILGDILGFYVLPVNSDKAGSGNVEAAESYVFTDDITDEEAVEMLGGY